MLQLTIPVEDRCLSMDGVLEEAVTGAMRLGVGEMAASRASEVVARRFQSLYGRRLTHQDARRVGNYYRGVVRRMVCRSGPRSDLEYRERLKLISAVSDLRSASMGGEVLRAELVDTLGFSVALVDEVLDLSAGAA